MKNIKRLILTFQICLFVSGITAFFIPEGMHLIIDNIILKTLGLNDWLLYVNEGVQHVDLHYQFFFYGTDWLAFAHVILAVLFIGAYQDPIRNIWLFKFGIIASVLVFPLALIMGKIRDIPLVWRCLDCCFGLLAIPLLWYILKRIKQLENDEFKPNFRRANAGTTMLFI